MLVTPGLCPGLILGHGGTGLPRARPGRTGDRGRPPDHPPDWRRPRRSTVRNLIAVAIAVVVLPMVAIVLLPVGQRHEWFAVASATLAAAALGVNGYAALTRREGFDPPERDPATVPAAQVA